MRRPVLLAVAAVASLGAASLAAILLVTSSGERPRALPPPEPVVDSAQPPPEGPLPPLAGTAPMPTPTAPPPLPAAMLLRVPTSARVSDEQRAWEQIRPLTRPMTPLVRALSGWVAPCFDEDTQARFGPRPHSALSDASGTAPGRGALLLELEMVEGGVRIVDAPVAELGAASDGLVACVQQALRGRTVSLPQLRYEPGQRLTMPYPLRPAGAQASGAAPAEGGPAAAAPPTRRQRGKLGPTAAP